MILIVAAVCSVAITSSFASNDTCTQRDTCLRNVEALLQKLGNDHISLNETSFKYLPANMTTDISKDLNSYYKQFDVLKNLTNNTEEEPKKPITSALRKLLQSLKEMQKHFKNQNDQKPKICFIMDNSTFHHVKSATFYVGRKLWAFLNSTKERTCPVGSETNVKPNSSDPLHLSSKPPNMKKGKSKKGNKVKKSNKKTVKTNTLATTSFINSTKTTLKKRKNKQKRPKTPATTPTQSTAHKKEKGRKKGKGNGLKKTTKN